MKQMPPQQLRDMPAWLCWKLVTVPGKKPRKIPFYATTGDERHGTQGSPEDRAQLVSYDQAVKAAQAGRYDGVGIALLQGAGLVALDFDDCVIDGRITEPLIAGLPAYTYTEFSPSGTGVRAFMLGELPSRKDTKPEPGRFKVEFFGNSGFVTVTGNVHPDCDLFGTADEVCPVTPEIDALYRQRFGDPVLGLAAGANGVTDENTARLMGLVPTLGWTQEQTRAYLFDVDAGCGRDTWLKLLMAVHHESDGADWALNLADEWSATGGSQYTGRRDVEGRWRSFGKPGAASVSGKKITGEWLLEVRKKCLADVQLVIAKLRTKPRDVILAQWPTAAQHLSHADVDVLREWVSKTTGTGVRTLDKIRNNAQRAAHAEKRAAAVLQRVGNRTTIRHRPEDATEQAAQVESLIVDTAAPGEYVQFAGVLSHVVVKAPKYAHCIDNPDLPAPPIVQIEVLDSVGTLEQVERVAVFIDVKSDGTQAPKAVPGTIIDVLRNKSVHAAPVVTGVVSHPIVLRDGTIQASDGLHRATGLFFTGAEVGGEHPYTQQEAAQALLRLRATIGDGFEFATPLDADVAVAALLTGVQRRILDQAPGLAVLASTQASGKTTLPRRIHVILTGRDMPASAFNNESDEAMAKRIHATLMTNPTLVCYDNIPDGFTFRSQPITGAMTSATIIDRVLGISRMVEVPTNTMFVITGNNLSLGADEISRWMVCRLAPKVARPERRQFKNPDVVAHALSVRDQVLRDAVGIVSGYIANAVKQPEGGSRFTQWSATVRRPLLWAGGLDIADVFDRNDAQSEEANAHRGLLRLLLEEFKDREFMATDVAKLAGGGMHTQSNDKAYMATDTQRDQLAETLGALRVARVDNAKSVGHGLKTKIDRIATIDGRDVKLTGKTNRNGVFIYQVVETMRG